MATALTLSEPVAYAGGEVTTSSQFVGYSGGKNCVLRYSFTTPTSGYITALTVTATLTKLDGTAISASYPVNVLISDDSSLTNIGPETAADAQFTAAGTQSVSITKRLNPGKTYYLYLYPGHSTYSAYYLYDNTGADQTVLAYTDMLSGLVYIDNGTSWDAYEVYIDDGASWAQYIPYIDDGTSWTMCN